MATYPNNLRGRISGLRDFSEQYASALRAGNGVSEIGGSEKSLVPTPPKTANLRR